MAGVSEEFKLDFKFGGNAEFLAKIEQLLERIDARFGSVEDSISDASDAVDEMDNSMSDLNDTFNEGVSTLQSFGERLKDVAKSFLTIYAMRSGLERVWSFGRESMDIYSTQERAENQLKGVLRNRGSMDQFDAIKAYAGSIQGRTIYGDEAMIKGAGELATYVKGTESLKSMMEVLTDYAAGMTGGGEVSPEQMESLATGLGMAYDGNYMAMRRKGFDTSKLEALDAIVENNGKWGAKDIKKYGDVLSADEIAQIRKQSGVSEQMKVDALRESLGDWQGLAEEVNKLDSSAIVRFNNKLGDLRENLGQKIYPVFNRLVDAIDKHTPDIEELFGKIGEMFESIADTISSNLDNLFEFGKWLASFIPDVVKLGSGIANAVGKVLELSDAVKYLISFMAAEKIRDFAESFGKMINGDGKTSAGIIGDLAKVQDAFVGEGGFVGAMKEFSKTALGSQVALIGITWGLKQIMELAGAVKEYFGQMDEEEKTKAAGEARSKASDEIIAAYKKYKKGTISEKSYKDTFEMARAKSGVKGFMKGSIYDIWAKDAAEKAKTDGKGSANLYQTFNNQHYEQNVELSADIDKVGLLLNMRMRKFIESQMRLDREGTIVAEVGG